MDVFRNIMYMARRFKTATLLNLAGLAVAFAALFLFMTQVEYSASYNRGIPHAERIMRVEAMMNGAPWNTNCCVPLLEVMMEMPEVESGTMFHYWGSKSEFYMGSTSVVCDMCRTRKETSLEPFGAVCLDGKLNWKDDTDQGAIIPASLAQRFLGTTMAAGRYLWTGKDSLRIIGVYQDFPDNCCVGNMIYTSLGEASQHDFSEWSYKGYLRLHETADVDAFRKEFCDKVKSIFRQKILSENAEEFNNATPEERAAMDQQLDSMLGQHNFRVTPLTETYFSGTDGGDRGNRTVHLILIWACILVVLVAAINFLNFTLAESPMRVKGVNTRRVLGSSLTSLRLGLIGETVVIALLAHQAAGSSAAPWIDSIGRSGYRRGRWSLSCMVRHFVPACNGIEGRFWPDPSRTTIAHPAGGSADYHQSSARHLYRHPYAPKPLHLPFGLWF